jgi:hypothetical protein
MRLRMVVLVAVGLFPAAAQADPVADVIAAAAAECEGFENGRFEAGDAVTEVDLDGEAPIDRIIDTAGFSCSSMASLYCGSGGCALYAVIGERSWQFQAEGWRMIDWDGRPILLVARDGGWCGGTGSQSCYEAVVWSLGDLLTVMPRN